jgi:hypothetical protein
MIIVINITTDTMWQKQPYCFVCAEDTLLLEVTLGVAIEDDVGARRDEGAVLLAAAVGVGTVAFTGTGTMEGAIVLIPVVGLSLFVGPDVGTVSDGSRGTDVGAVSGVVVDVVASNPAVK